MIELESIPELADPVLIAAFEGWNDAGDSASGVVAHLQREWGATPIAELDPEDYYDFQVNRPVIQLADGASNGLSWPTTRLYLARPPGMRRDFLLLRGPEPNTRWRSFTDEIISGVHDLGVRLRQVLLLGAYLSDSPHSRPVTVSASGTRPELISSFAAETVQYEGPTGILGVLEEAYGAAGLDAVSLWAPVPHYVAQPPNPKATLALLRRLEELVEENLPLGDLAEEARAWERGVDELTDQDTEVADYVRELEERRDATDLPEASGEAIAREFERYLRRREG